MTEEESVLDIKKTVYVLASKIQTHMLKYNIKSPRLRSKMIEILGMVTAVLSKK
jgi:hypothetical protein